jgi:hypothetical protein
MFYMIKCGARHKGSNEEECARIPGHFGWGKVKMSLEFLLECKFWVDLRVSAMSLVKKATGIGVFDSKSECGMNFWIEKRSNVRFFLSKSD